MNPSNKRELRRGMQDDEEDDEITHYTYGRIILTFLHYMYKDKVKAALI